MKKYIKLMDFVYKLYAYQLINCDEAYEILRERIVDPLIIDEFELGLAGSDNELTYEVAHMYKEMAMLKELHLIKWSDKTNDQYDTFKERIIFPIRDEFGNASGLGGWAIFYNKHKALRDAAPDNKKDSVFVPAKYINSSTSILFNKSDIVYNLHRAKESIKKMGFAYLAEGFFDVISIHSSCRDDGQFRTNVVSTMGTSLTRGQAAILKTYTDKILICYDGDSAGQEAALKAIDILEYAGLKVRVSVLPTEHDPDSYFKEHDNLDVLDTAQFNVNQFKFMRWWDTINTSNKETQLSYILTTIYKEFPSLMQGASRTTICPLIAVMAIELDVSEISLSLDLCIIDPNLFGFPYMFNVKALVETDDMAQYLKDSFNQTEELKDKAILTKRERKEKIAYEKMQEMWER